MEGKGESGRRKGIGMEEGKGQGKVRRSCKTIKFQKKAKAEEGKVGLGTEIPLPCFKLMYN